MTLSDWLSKISPDVVTGALTLLTTLGTWAWAKARGKQTKSFEAIIKDVLDNFLAELLDDYAPSDKTTDFLAHARDYIEARAWKVLAKRGVPKTVVTQNLLHAGIERATAELGSSIARKNIPHQLDSMAEKIAEITKLFNPPAKAPETPPS